MEAKPSNLKDVEPSEGTAALKLAPFASPPGKTALHLGNLFTEEQNLEIARLGKNLRKKCVKSTLQEMQQFLDQVQEEHGERFLFAVLQAGNRNAKQAIHFASQLASHVEVLRHLIQRRANVNACTVRGHTPLLFAAGRGRSEHVHLLLDCRASPLVRTVCGDTAAGMAVGRVDAQTLQRLRTAEEQGVRPRLADSPLPYQSPILLVDDVFGGTNKQDDDQTDAVNSGRASNPDDASEAADFLLAQNHPDVIRRPRTDSSFDYSGDSNLHPRTKGKKKKGPADKRAMLIQNKGAAARKNSDSDTSTSTTGGTGSARSSNDLEQVEQQSQESGDLSPAMSFAPAPRRDQESQEAARVEKPGFLSPRENELLPTSQAAERIESKADDVDAQSKANLHSYLLREATSTPKKNTAAPAASTTRLDDDLSSGERMRGDTTREDVEVEQPIDREEVEELVMGTVDSSKYLDFRCDPDAIAAQKEHIVQCKHCRKNPSNWRHLFGDDEAGFAALVCKLAQYNKAENYPEESADVIVGINATRGQHQDNFFINSRRTAADSDMPDTVSQETFFSSFCATTTTSEDMRSIAIKFLRDFYAVDTRPFAMVMQRFAKTLGEAVRRLMDRASPAVSASEKAAEPIFIYMSAFFQEPNFLKNHPEDRKCVRVCCAAALEALRHAIVPRAVSSPTKGASFGEDTGNAEDGQLKSEARVEEVSSTPSGLGTVDDAPSGECFYTAPLRGDIPWWVARMQDKERSAIDGPICLPVGRDKTTESGAGKQTHVNEKMNKARKEYTTPRFAAVSLAEVHKRCDCAATALEVLGILQLEARPSTAEDDGAAMEKIWSDFLLAERSSADQNRCRRWLRCLELVCGSSTTTSAEVEAKLKTVVSLAVQSGLVPQLLRSAKLNGEHAWHERLREMLETAEENNDAGDHDPDAGPRVLDRRKAAAKQRRQQRRHEQAARREEEDEFEAAANRAGNNESEDEEYNSEEKMIDDAGAQESNRIPHARLEGPITWIDTTAGLEEMQGLLRRQYEASSSRKVHVGLDTEWGYSKSGTATKCCMMTLQVSFLDAGNSSSSGSSGSWHNYVIDTSPDAALRSDEYSRALEEFLVTDLMHPSCLPLGFSFGHDIPKIAALLQWLRSGNTNSRPAAASTEEKDKLDVDVFVCRFRQQVLDVQQIYTQWQEKSQRLMQKNVKRGATPGLRAVTAALLGQDLSKKEQRSDWALRPLTSRQLQYAALDAQVLVRLADIILSSSSNKADH
ncbi:unnamed protein product [Amoebophrya sp. A120]|nr:unnamed protein product [Amoebophrya sp. A120]|eukprot:GSA120T00019114001.1